MLGRDEFSQMAAHKKKVVFGGVIYDGGSGPPARMQTKWISFPLQHDRRRGIFSFPLGPHLLYTFHLLLHFLFKREVASSVCLK